VLIGLQASEPLFLSVFQAHTLPTATQTLEKRIKQESCCSNRSFLSGTARSIKGGSLRSKNSAWCSRLFHCRHQKQQRFQAVFLHPCIICLRKVREPLRRVRKTKPCLRQKHLRFMSPNKSSSCCGRISRRK